MSSNRTKSNEHLRRLIAEEFDEYGEIRINEFIKKHNQRYYRMCNARVSSLVRERDDVKRVEPNHWVIVG